MKEKNKKGQSGTWLRKMLPQGKNFLAVHQYVMILFVLAVAVLFPAAVKNSYYRGIGIKILMYMLLASSVNVINGYSGQFAIGHAGFMCVGAYTAAILTARLGWNFFPALLAGGIMAALFGLLVSFPISKLSGIYLGFVTLGFSEIVRIICLNWTSVTGGPMGIKAIPGPKLFGLSLQSSQGYYYIILVVLVFMVFCTSRILKSRTGRAWISIRENESAAASIGINTARYKMINIMYGTFWEGCAGAFMASYYHFVDSTMFVTDESFNILSMAIVGGMGTIVGPLIGAFVINFITEALRFLMDYRMVIYALLIIGTMWLRPQGIAGSADSVLVSGSSMFQRKKRRTARPKPVHRDTAKEAS